MTIRTMPDGAMFPMSVDAYERYIIAERDVREYFYQINCGHVTLESALMQPIGSKWDQAAMRAVARISAQFEDDEEIDFSKILVPSCWEALQARNKRAYA